MRLRLLCLPFLLGCPKAADVPDPDASTTDDSPATQAPSLGDGAANASPLAPQPVAVRQCADADQDPLTVTDARVEGDTLIATVQYGGGCQEHTFVACWDGTIAESMPTQTTLRIIHDGHNDTCRARKIEALALDLAPLAPAKPTIIHLHGQSVPYGQ